MKERQLNGRTGESNPESLPPERTVVNCLKETACLVGHQG